MDWLLDIDDLHKRFVIHAVGGREVVALRGVSLRVHPGEHVALAGSSGAGKSSLLKCVHRTYRVDAGRVRFRLATGAVVDLASLDDRAVRMVRAGDIGYVSQFLRAEPRRGVFETVARGARRRGLDEEAASDAAAAVLRHLHIGEQLWRTYPSLLSGGEKQRVNLAAGIVVPPRLLLLDEPVSALDPVNRESVLMLLAGLTSSGVGVLSVFHDLDAMERLADRVVTLQDGIVVDGVVDRIGAGAGS